MTDPLQKLFGSAARIKLLRLFLFNPKTFYTVPEAATHARITERAARAEIKMFNETRLVRRAPTRKKSGLRFGLNPNFEYTPALQTLLLNPNNRAQELPERLRSAGGLKLIVVGGVFMNDWDGRLDMLLVGDRVNEKRLKARTRTLESDMGKELRYALLSTQDFFYRLNMNDKLVRDVMDYPHRIIHDRLDIGLK